MKLKPRPQYLSKLVAAQDNSLIKVITGMRRCSSDSIFCSRASPKTTSS